MSYKEHLNQGVSAQTEHVRPEVVHHQGYPKHDLFTLTAVNRKYDRQFFSMYQYRYQHLKERVLTNATAKWGNGTKKVDGQIITKQDKILDIQSGQLCWVIGTVFCDLKNKLNILQDVEKGVDDVLPAIPDTYVGAGEDGGDSVHSTVILEDESGRAILHNDEYIKKNVLVTGCIVAVLGIEIEAGIFEIMDVAYPTIAPQKPLKLHPEGQNRVAIVSGLDIGAGADEDLKLELLKQLLAGELGSEQDSQAMANVSRLIIAGDSIRPMHEIDAENDRRDFVTTNNYGSKNTSKLNAESVVKLDQFVHDIVTHMAVSIMPGNKDPAEICLPQQRLHRSLLHSNFQFMNQDRLEVLTNPHWFELADGIRVLGTSGQNIDDILKYLPPHLVDEDKIIHVMESTIKWQNFVPTAPDTLYCYPYDDFDPFVLEDETPHVYFAGNQKQFASKLYEYESEGKKESVRLISVPKFGETGQVVLLNVDTLETEVITIEI